MTSGIYVFFSFIKYNLYSILEKWNRFVWHESINKDCTWGLCVKVGVFKLHKIVGPYWLLVVPCWPTIRNVRLSVALVKEPFANKDSTVVQPLAVQNPAHIHSKIGGFCLFIIDIYTLPLPNSFDKVPMTGQQSVLFWYIGLSGDVVVCRSQIWWINWMVYTQHPTQVPKWRF